MHFSRLPQQLLGPREVVYSRYKNILLPQIITGIRHASSKSKKQLVLEKPAKFNPPSHGARLRKPGIKYSGPPLTAEDIARQGSKKYPNMMPPEGTFMHWFIHNRLLHLWLSLVRLSFKGTLTSLAVTVFVTNFKRNSPFADMLPDWYSLFLHPIKFWRTLTEVIKLDTVRVSEETAARRKERVEEVTKRAAFRKAHGLSENAGLGAWVSSTNNGTNSLDGRVKIQNGEVADVPSQASNLESQTEIKEEVQEKRPIKKWLGIW
ncbi:BgTH12-03598 [Blumeria graminis f. sp. triticale]|uniref:Bgt-3502 n=3 Tax=Blumeria graminis TaxID=34373 RepID=A0A061HMT2_BLUGR|nr:hypothetical protein BGT96224_3502 [Blumeria graminis f. sp. tritici 96224]CAD6499484.1 BgTH12-03598 [Blumeria graminis f. sp. triticale]VCU39651.1 Bgt-3502 [Blumeria graminis f. sp. tritici]